MIRRFKTLRVHLFAFPGTVEKISKTAYNPSGQSDQCESDLDDEEVELCCHCSCFPSLPLQVSTHRMSHFCLCPGSGGLSPVCNIGLMPLEPWCGQAHSQPRSPVAPLDAYALQDESTLIDPTCHAEAMANFSTACIWNSGDGKLTWFNNSQWKKASG